MSKENKGKPSFITIYFGHGRYSSFLWRNVNNNVAYNTQTTLVKNLHFKIHLNAYKSVCEFKINNCSYYFKMFTRLEAPNTL